MEDIVKIFAANLNRLMEDRGENLTQLSDRIGVAYSTVSDWQHGRKMPFWITSSPQTLPKEQPSYGIKPEPGKLSISTWKKLTVWLP